MDWADARDYEKALFGRFVADPSAHVLRWTSLDLAGERLVESLDGYDDLKELSRAGGLLHTVGMLARPGVARFAELLENTYYPPGTVRNVDFAYRVVK